MLLQVGGRAFRRRYGDGDGGAISSVRCLLSRLLLHLHLLHLRLLSARVRLLLSRDVRGAGRVLLLLQLLMLGHGRARGGLLEMRRDRRRVAAALGRLRAGRRDLRRLLKRRRGRDEGRDRRFAGSENGGGGGGCSGATASRRRGCRDLKRSGDGCRRCRRRTDCDIRRRRVEPAHDRRRTRTEPHRRCRRFSDRLSCRGHAESVRRRNSGGYDFLLLCLFSNGREVETGTLRVWRAVVGSSAVRRRRRRRVVLPRALQALHGLLDTRLLGRRSRDSGRDSPASTAAETLPPLCLVLFRRGKVVLELEIRPLQPGVEERR